MYGATITARSLDTGETLTFARTDRTAVEATREIVELLDELDDNYRVVSISTPNSIQRDMYASRISLSGASAGVVGSTPEQWLLSQVKRPEMLHPDCARMADGNARRPSAPHRSSAA